MTGGIAALVLRTLVSTTPHFSSDTVVARSSRCDVYFVEAHSFDSMVEPGKKGRGLLTTIGRHESRGWRQFLWGYLSTFIQCEGISWIRTNEGRLSVESRKQDATEVRLQEARNLERSSAQNSRARDQPASKLNQSPPGFNVQLHRRYNTFLCYQGKGGSRSNAKLKIGSILPLAFKLHVILVTDV